MGSSEQGKEGRLFEIRGGKGRLWWWFYVGSVLLGFVLIWVYRAAHLPEAGEKGRWAWTAVFAAELWFGFYWLLTLSVRWNPIYRFPFRDRLSQRFEDKLPGVDIFICTADPTIEPPTIAINTVLSVLAYDYPSEKLSVYLSDDGGSILTFYGMLEASRFAKSWIPFCKKFGVEPLSPAAFFSRSAISAHDPGFSEWSAMEKLYKDMERRINAAVEAGDISEEIKAQHEAFSEWNFATNSKDHQPIVKILVDGRDRKARDVEGYALPTVVYMAREKRPKYHHNFKAGALNALLRVSAEISNGPIILNLDCDMYANSASSIRDALCFFMDEERGHDYAFVQYPQRFTNSTKHNLYASFMTIIQQNSDALKVDFPGLDGQGGPAYTGTGCFHRRECLQGKIFDKKVKVELKGKRPKIEDASASNLEEIAGNLATCNYEENTQWGKEMGVKYGCPVEDVITGFAIQCRGWKSVYCNPKTEAFLGLAPTTLSQALVQHKRWSEGDLQILLSKYCPFLYGHGRMNFGLQMGYTVYCCWAFNSLPTLAYVVIPSICLLHGISLFPSVSSYWFIPFASVISISTTYSLWESITNGETLQGWWNEQRMKLYKRTTSYLFGLVDTILNLMGISNSTFVITPKVADEEALKRYEQEIMEFGSASPMFTILSAVAMLNPLCLVEGGRRVIMEAGFGAFSSRFLLQSMLSGSLVLINLPIYQASFFRTDKGCIRTSTTLASIAIAMIAFLLPVM
ncbi:Cellulose synthase-like protein E6 [Apostasia shenzhenica]|uniref:Cellulose synthase-like protein E6 n=1 Tax=Apostasia shenzhenica TaxID=1088818 RepID=A0A2I0A0U1_9ASPA|nr:Cellulose synthase-like protein E6 [Apostasia shenzhenica]